MFRRNRLPELLAPAGDMECLYAAVAAGADAIYVGGKRFGARAFAKNFEIDELAEAVRYCHLHGVRLYVTLNTLIEDRELAEAVEYAASLYRIGVDALIVCDLGVIRAIRRCVPDLELHASTQMSVHNTYGVKAVSDMGISRAVVARELSLAEIKSVVDSSPIEIEVFLHGALCVCHSGQCLFSSMVGGRSGNRGECAQPCRLPYNNGKYPLSLKDLSLADHIPSLLESGVSSLKIEGRMKSPEYVYAVTGVYRRLLDEGRAANGEERELLRRAFSRGGFTDGYFVGKTDRGMTGIRSEKDKQDSRAIGSNTYLPKKLPVRASVTLRLGEPCEMTISDGNRAVTVCGQTPALAENSPLTRDGVAQRLAKMGNTGLSLSPDDIEINLDENINLPPSALNALRRDAADKFESCDRDLPPVSYKPDPECRKNRQKPLTTAQFFSVSAFLEAHSRGRLSKEINIAFLPHTADVDALVRAGGVYLPPVIFDSELAEVEAALENARKSGVMYALVSNIGQIDLAKRLGFEIFGDFRLNVTNSESRLAYEKMGVDRLILSPELTLPKARDIGGSLITYGRIPLMITERCFISENFGCDKCGKAALTDRKGEKFPLMREFEHRNIIFNSVPTYMGDRPGELSSHRIESEHFIFSTESGREIISVLDAISGQSPLPRRVRRIGRR